MRHRTEKEAMAMSYEQYKADIWTRLAEGWREFVGNPLHNQQFIAERIANADRMRDHWVAVYQGTIT